MKKLTTTSTIDNAPRIPFNKLRYGDRYRHSVDGGVHQVYFKANDGSYITIRRADDWLIRVDRGGFCWDEGVVKV